MNCFKMEFPKTTSIFVFLLETDFNDFRLPQGIK